MAVFGGVTSCGFVEMYRHFYRNKQSSSSEKHLSYTKTLDISWRETVRPQCSEAALQLSSEMDISNWIKEITKNLKKFCIKVFVTFNLITTYGKFLEKLTTEHYTERSHS